jgi:hypothetical protein
VHGAIMTNPVTSVRGRVVAALRGVRRPVWIVAGAVGIALVAALVLVPSEPAPAHHPRATSVVHRAGGATAAPSASALPGSAGGSVPTAAPEDPVSALSRLLALRAGCVRDRSIQCLAAVDEPASGAFARDSAIISAVTAGGQVPATASIVATAPTLVETLGDSVLVSLGPHSNPASALLIRGEAGWRIRDFSSGTPVTSTGGGPP